MSYIADAILNFIYDLDRLTGFTSLIEAGELGYTLSQRQVVTAAIILAIGALWCFFGHFMRNFWGATVSFILGFLAGAVVGLHFTDDVNFILILASITSVCFTYLTLRVQLLGSFLLTAFFVSVLLITIIWANTSLLLGASIFIGILIGLASLKLEAPIVIIVTSVTGGYFAGEAIRLIFETSRLIHLTTMIIIVVLGVFVQFFTESLLKRREDLQVAKDIREGRLVFDSFGELVDAKAYKEAMKLEAAKAEEEARLLEEAKAREEAERLEAARAVEEARLLEAKRLEEAKAREEAERLEAARAIEEARLLEAARLEEARAMEEAARLEVARAMEEAARLEAARAKAEAKRLEVARIRDEAKKPARIKDTIKDLRVVPIDDYIKELNIVTISDRTPITKVTDTKEEAKPTKKKVKKSTAGKGTTSKKKSSTSSLMKKIVINSVTKKAKPKASTTPVKKGSTTKSIKNKSVNRKEKES